MVLIFFKKKESFSNIFIILEGINFGLFEEPDRICYIVYIINKPA